MTSRHPKSHSQPIKHSDTPSPPSPTFNTILQPSYDNMPNHDFNCQCHMCHSYRNIKFKQALALKTMTVNNKIRARLTAKSSQKIMQMETNYKWILEHLQLPNNKIATNCLNVYISESLFFKDGEAAEIFVTKDLEDPTIKKIAKEKLNGTFIQKVMTDRRRKYKDYIRVKTGRKKSDNKKKVFYGQKQTRKQIKDAVIIRYVDGYEQLISENQFLSLFLKRKQDPFWKQVLSIRNFIYVTNPEQIKTSYFVVKFKRDQIQHKQLWERAKILSKINSQYIRVGQKEYIPPIEQAAFCRQLQITNPKHYAEYLNYQIVTFVQYFYDEQIGLIVTGLYFDEIGHAFINQVFKLEAKSLIKFEWTNETYKSKMDFEESKVLQKKTKVYINDNQVSGQRASIIVRAMHSAYQKMRDMFGLTAEEEDDYQEKANNKFFKELHPNLNSDISQILKDPNLNLSEFKKVYLGETPKRKPLVKQFNSNMIKTLHLTTPKLRRSAPHNYISSPKKSPSISLSIRDEINSSAHARLKFKYQKSKMYQTLPVI